MNQPPGTINYQSLPIINHYQPLVTIITHHPITMNHQLTTINPLSTKMNHESIGIIPHPPSIIQPTTINP